MKTPETTRRQFVHLSRAWYGQANLNNHDYVDDVTFGLYCPDGGTEGEMSVKWHPLNGKQVPCLEVFDDAWYALYTFADILPRLATANNQNCTPEQFCQLLRECGFVDATPEQSPYTT